MGKAAIKDTFIKTKRLAFTMGNGNIKNMKVREEDLIKSRRLNFGDRLYDWEIFKSLLSFCESHPKQFEKWKKQNV